MSGENDKISKKLNTSILVLKISLVFITIVTIYGLVSQKHFTVLLGIVGLIMLSVALKIFISTKKEYETALKQTLDSFTVNPDEYKKGE